MKASRSLEQHRLRLGADDRLHDLAALVDVHRRDRGDAVLRGGRGFSSTLSLTMVDLVRVLAGDLLEDRGDLAARAAPLGPEVDEHRLVVLEHVGGEGGVGDGLGALPTVVPLEVQWFCRLASAPAGRWCTGLRQASTLTAWPPGPGRRCGRRPRGR